MYVCMCTFGMYMCVHTDMSCTACIKQGDKKYKSRSLIEIQQN